MATVFLNGEFVQGDAARVSAFDAGLYHGVGVFDTMLAVTTPRLHIIHLHEHLSRLTTSASTLALTQTLRLGALAEACELTLERAAAQTPSPCFRLRVTVTGGDLNLLDRSSTQRAHPTLLIVAQPATEYPIPMFTNGVAATIADLKVNPLDPLTSHKTLNYWGRLRELQLAAAKGAAEALVFQISNHLAGGCVSNAMIIKNGRLCTPIVRGEESEVAQERGEVASGTGQAVMPSPVLPGVVRRWVLDWCVGADIEVDRRMLSISDVIEADELFLTNSSWGVLPVVRVESRSIGLGKPGPVTAGLVAAWRELAGLEACGEL